MTYRYPVALTQQFRFCGNAFRIDLYKGCDFGCLYCFVTSRNGGFSQAFDSAEIEQVEKLFEKAFTVSETKNLTLELLKHRVPLHLGGMSDPFQKREDTERLTYRFLELTNKYDYPVIISTKAGDLSDEFWKILNPEIHAFQISLMGLNENFIRKYETFSPLPEQRIYFMNKLKESNFWVSCRIQPLIDINEALSLTEKINNIVNYITVEHLKIPVDNKNVRKLFSEQMETGDYIKPKQGRAYELRKELKLENIKRILEVAKIPVGIGDNDLHEYSQSRNCCGVDTINSNFNNWLKYNYTYFCTGEFSGNEWYPCSDCNSSVNSSDRVKGLKNVKDYTDYYIKKFQHSILNKEEENNDNH
jgi:DNA repair photolyase